MFQVVNEKTLGYDLFVQKVKEKVQILMGEGYDVRIQQVVKNNSLKLDSLIVVKKGRNVAPNIYLNPYYESYLQGTKLDEITQRLYDIYNHCSIPTISKDLGNNLDEIKKSIIFKVVNYKMNTKELEKVPFTRFMDFAITYHYVVKSENEVIGSIRISHEHVEHWGITIKELNDLATENTQRIFPAVIRDMDDVIREFINEDETIKDEEFENICMSKQDDQVKMYVLSNKNSVNGATCLLYDNVIKNFSESVKSDLIIIPSSIHEIILLPIYKEMEIEELNNIVKEVNASQVPAEEVLSERVYIYSREDNKIIM